MSLRLKWSRLVFGSSFFSFSRAVALICTIALFQWCLQLPVMAEAVPDASGLHHLWEAVPFNLSATPPSVSGAHLVGQAPPIVPPPAPIVEPPAGAPAPGIKLLPPMPEPSADTGGVSNYYLGPGDRLAILDYSSSDRGEPLPEYSIVLPDGTAMIHPLGCIKVVGMTLKELNSYVNQMASRWLKNPDIEISVSRTRQVSIYVFGEVIYPGYYQPGIAMPGRAIGIGGSTSQGATVEEQGAVGGSFGTELLTVTSALQLAGGLKETADVRNIRVTRRSTGQVLRADLWQFLQKADLSQDLVLQPGDVVYVPKGTDALSDATELGLAVNTKPRVRVWGAVKAPGLYQLENDDDVLSVIARAGGFGPGAKTKQVVLARLQPNGTVSTQLVDVPHSVVDASGLGRSKVRPNDVIIVNENPLRKNAGKIVTYGATFVSAVGVLAINYAFIRGVVRLQARLFNQPNVSPGGLTITPVNSGSSRP